MPKLDTDFRSMTTDALTKEYNDIEFNGDDWAVKRRFRITEELERRGIHIGVDGNIVIEEDEEG